MRIGEATMRPVVEIERLVLPPQMFISDFSSADVEAHGWLANGFYDPETAQCHLSQHAWLIEANGKRILVDPCVGHQRQRNIAFYDMLDSPFLDNLRGLGVEPESIDYVFCTHLHLDHCGWNTQAKDGRWVPTFPNARYVMSRADEAYWRADAEVEKLAEEDFNARVYDECVRPVIEAGLVDLVEPGATIGDCITLIDAGGHTVGHMAGILESAGEGAVLAGDAIHHPIQVLHCDRDIHADDPERARLTRHRLLGLCADNDWWLAPAHFVAPHACKVRRSRLADGRDGYRMEWPET